MTISNPTRSKNPSNKGVPVEVEAWREESQIVTLMSFNFSYWDAYHMSPRDYRRYAGINAALSIPADDREAGVRVATQADIDMAFRNM